MILLRLFPPAAMALVWRLAIVLAGAFAVYVVWTSPPMELPSTAPAPRPARQTHTGDASKATMASVTQTYPEIAERPLFYPSRKAWAPPPPPPAPVVSTAPPPLTDYALVGVILSGNTRSALIRTPGGSKTITLGEGQELQGWKLQEITRDRLRFAAGDAQYDMNFPKPSEIRR
jgi:type II secretory pathway component PulC